MRAATDPAEGRLSGWCDLPGSPLAPSLARRWVSAMLDSWELRASGADEATIAGLTSELVTNAVQHAARAGGGTHGIKINLRVDHDLVWLAVCDPDPTLPMRRAPDSLTENGRGLCLVAAQADQWGAVQHGDGKYVWFSLRVFDGSRHTDETARSGRPLTASRPAS